MRTRGLRIRSTVHHDEQFGEQIMLVVEDDGEGVAPEQRQFVLQRGARADTLAAGQGIGLAVVSDIVASYSGSIEIDARPDCSLSAARGLRFGSRSSLLEYRAHT
jgi:signal transduction histidine kinase